MADRPELLPKLRYLWEMFLDLRAASESSISYTDIVCYQQIYGSLSPFEVDIIRLLDNLAKEARQ